MIITVKERFQRFIAGITFDRAYKYIRKNPADNIIKLIDLGQKLMGSNFPVKNYDAFRNAVRDPSNVWNRFAMSVINECDGDYLKKMLLAL